MARQLGELRQYFASFQRNLSDRCTRKPYGELAQFAGSRYIRLLGLTVRALLDVDVCSGGSQIPAAPPGGGSGGGGGSGIGHIGAATPTAARRKLGVSFADGGAGDQPSPSPPIPPPHHPASPGPGGWPGVPHYSTFPAAYYPPSGAAYTPPRYDPLSSPPGLSGWSGYSGPVTSGSRPRPRPWTPGP